MIFHPARQRRGVDDSLPVDCHRSLDDFTQLTVVEVAMTVPSSQLAIRHGLDDSLIQLASYSSRS